MLFRSFQSVGRVGEKRFLITNPNPQQTVRLAVSARGLKPRRVPCAIVGRSVRARSHQTFGATPTIPQYVTSCIDVNVWYVTIPFSTTWALHPHVVEKGIVTPTPWMSTQDVTYCERHEVRSQPTHLCVIRVMTRSVPQRAEKQSGWMKAVPAPKTAPNSHSDGL